MTRYRLEPTRQQETTLLRHCSDARYAWNLAVEQHAWWRPGRRSAPGYLEQSRQLTAARADNPRLAEGSQTVQQQALRDFARATAGFFAGTHRRPSWRKAGRDEGFRITGHRGRQWDVRRLNRNWGQVRVPKAGWVRFRWSRDVPADARSFRVTRDRAGRWHVAFAVIPAPVQGPGTGEAVGIDRGVRVSAALSTVSISPVDRAAKGTAEQPGRNVRAKTGMNREISRSGWGLLVRRLEDKAPGRVEKAPAAYTSQRCSACGHVDGRSRESQARFRCTACGYAGNADVNAARNIAAGHAVKARQGDGASRPVNREPQLLASQRA